MLANITAALLIFSENSIAQLTLPCLGSPTRAKTDGAIVILVLYKASKSTLLVKSSISAHSVVPLKTVTSSCLVGTVSGQGGS